MLDRMPDAGNQSLAVKALSHTFEFHHFQKLRFRRAGHGNYASEQRHTRTRHRRVRPAFAFFRVYRNSAVEQIFLTAELARDGFSLEIALSERKIRCFAFLAELLTFN